MQQSISSPRMDGSTPLEVLRQEDPQAVPEMLEKAAEELDRMRYFRNLLEMGYRHALLPDEDPDTLRSQRVALGIPLPELDLVPVWSCRTPDGTFSIPFIDFLLGQFSNLSSGSARTCAKPAGLVLCSGRTRPAPG